MRAVSRILMGYADVADFTRFMLVFIPSLSFDCIEIHSNKILSNAPAGADSYPNAREGAKLTALLTCTNAVSRISLAAVFSFCNLLILKPLFGVCNFKPILPAVWSL